MPKATQLITHRAGIQTLMFRLQHLRSHGPSPPSFHGCDKPPFSSFDSVQVSVSFLGYLHSFIAGQPASSPISSRHPSKQRLEGLSWNPNLSTKGPAAENTVTVAPWAARRRCRAPTPPPTLPSAFSPSPPPRAPAFWSPRLRSCWRLGLVSFSPCFLLQSSQVLNPAALPPRSRSKDQVPAMEVTSPSSESQQPRAHWHPAPHPHTCPASPGAPAGQALLPPGPVHSWAQGAG